MGNNQQLVNMSPLGSPATLDALGDYVLMQMLGHGPGGGGGEIPMIQYRYCRVEQIPFLLNPGKPGVQSMGLVVSKGRLQKKNVKSMVFYQKGGGGGLGG